MKETKPITIAGSKFIYTIVSYLYDDGINSSSCYDTIFFLPEAEEYIERKWIIFGPKITKYNYTHAFTLSGMNIENPEL